MMESYSSMTLLRIFIFVLIISTNFLHLDSRALRKRRQFSSASYYISGVNPYANPNVDPASLTYPSGSFYNAPNYINSETAYTGSGNLYGSQTSLYNQASPYMYNTNMQYPNTYYGNNLYGYGPGGFNNRFPNWNQGNYAQYYTGGTGSGLSNTLNYWYRSLRPSASSGPIMNNQMGPMMMAPPGRR